MNSEQLFRAVFSCFHGQKFILKTKNLHCRVRTKKLLDTKVIFFFFKLGRNFLELKTGVFFRASCFGFRVKGVSPLLLPLVSLHRPLHEPHGPCEFCIPLGLFQTVQNSVDVKLK